MLLTTETETFMLYFDQAYQPALKWQNVVCKIEESPLKYCEAIAEWQTKLNQSSSFYFYNVEQVIYKWVTAGKLNLVEYDPTS